MLKKLTFSIFVMALFTGCGGGGEDGLGEEGVSSFDISFPEEAAHPDLFGVWTFESELSHDCSPEWSSIIPPTAAQELNVLQTETEHTCRLSYRDDQGEFLSKTMVVFEEESDCQAGGDVLVLEFVDFEGDQGCSLTVESRTRMVLQADGSLEGPVEVVLLLDSSSENCPFKFDSNTCSVNSVLRGTKGAHIQGGWPYFSPPVVNPPPPPPEEDDDVVDEEEVAEESELELPRCEELLGTEDDVDEADLPLCEGLYEIE